VSGGVTEGVIPIADDGGGISTDGGMLGCIIGDGE